MGGCGGGWGGGGIIPAVCIGPANHNLCKVGVFRGEHGHTLRTSPATVEN